MPLQTWIKDLSFDNPSAGLIMEVYLEELESIEAQKKKVEKQLVELSKGRYKEIVGWLRSLPGIGLLGAITLITEVKDINRFSSLDKFHSFVGLVPNVNSSAETEKVGGITQRHNKYLRTIIVQCAWKAAYQDPGLFRTYNKLCKKMKANKAIIRIAKKLLNRVSYVWKNECEYKIQL